MTFELLETVVLSRDLPEHDLRAGDLGAVVHMYADVEFEVEFVRASGHTQALVTVTAGYIRPVAANDMLAVRAS